MKMPVTIKSFNVRVHGGIDLVLEIPEQYGHVANQIVEWKVKQTLLEAEIREPAARQAAPAIQQTTRKKQFEATIAAVAKIFKKDPVEFRKAYKQELISRGVIKESTNEMTDQQLEREIINLQMSKRP